jgi:hypothetical protein
MAHTKNTTFSAHDSDLDLDLDLDIKSGGGLKSISSREEAPPEKPPPTTTTVFLKTQEAARKAGFNITADIARGIVNSGLDPGWLDGGFNFLEYAARFIRGAYPGKPDPELRRLFITATGGRGEPPWDNLLDEYPAWRKTQESAARKERAAHARDHPPERCPGCGGAMDMLKCPECGGFVEFREQNLSWDFVPPGDFDLSRDFRDKIQHKDVPKPVLDF